jgi:hypothetical protein
MSKMRDIAIVLGDATGVPPRLIRLANIIAGTSKIPVIILAGGTRCTDWSLDDLHTK